MAQFPIIVLDDGSEPSVDEDLLQKFPNAILHRNECARGHVVARNQIVEKAKTPYVLQLDDDSYPVSGSIQDLISEAQTRENWLAFALQYEEPKRSRAFPFRKIIVNGLKLRAFVGCSALINVSSFRSIGGYSEWIDGYRT